jgi:hypothetical protein
MNKKSLISMDEREAWGFWFGSLLLVINFRFSFKNSLFLNVSKPRMGFSSFTEIIQSRIIRLGC